MLGLRDLQGGSVKLFGETGPMLRCGARPHWLCAPQRSDLFEGFTPQQLLAYFRSFYPRWNTAKVDGLMSRWTFRATSRLRASRAGSSSACPSSARWPMSLILLVLDEPVASLDPAGRRDFLRELVDQVLDRGTTVVLSTHILSDLERVAFNVAFMRDGQIGVQAPLDELLENTRQVTGDRATVQALLRHGAQVLQTPRAGG